MLIAPVVAAVASLGTPLITSMATSFHVSLGSAQWTLTVALLSGAVATPVLGRLGAGPHRRATILATLAVVVAGSALTVLPLPFAWLLAGRAAQGAGIGLTALMIGVARDHLPEERSAAVIALISVVSIIGAGVGYPLAALLAELGGVRAAYGLGLIVTAAALLTAWRSMPAAPEGRLAHVDVAGAVVLAAALLLVLGFVAGKFAAGPEAGRRPPAPGGQRRCGRRRVRPVRGGPVGPGRTVRGDGRARLRRRRLLGRDARRHPGRHPQWRDVERHELQLRRPQHRVLPGSAIGGLILAAGTGPGHLFPGDRAYTTAALVGIGAMAITTLTSLALARRRPSETNP
nr:MFS transporter [Streptomyces sp. SID5470]